MLLSHILRAKLRSAKTMEEMEIFQRVNGYYCFFAGTGLNTVLVWLVRKQSTPELKVYSRILLQTAVVDLVYLTVMFIYMPVSIDIEPCS